jgi:hypothetical protein
MKHADSFDAADYDPDAAEANAATAAAFTDAAATASFVNHHHLPPPHPRVQMENFERVRGGKVLGKDPGKDLGKRNSVKERRKKNKKNTVNGVDINRISEEKGKGEGKIADGTQGGGDNGPEREKGQNIMEDTQRENFSGAKRGRVSSQDGVPGTETEEEAPTNHQGGEVFGQQQQAEMGNSEEKGEGDFSGVSGGENRVPWESPSWLLYLQQHRVDLPGRPPEVDSATSWAGLVEPTTVNWAISGRPLRATTTM